jgi:hypothetical protein
MNLYICVLYIKISWSKLLVLGFKLYHKKLHFQRLFNTTLGKAECKNICNVTTVYNAMWGYILVLLHALSHKISVSKDCPTVHWKNRTHKHNAECDPLLSNDCERSSYTTDVTE